MVARYNRDGTPDTAFGEGTGRVSTKIGDVANAVSVAVQSDGKIVVAGSILIRDEKGFRGYFGLARYNSDGSPDAQFGDGTGKVLTPVPNDCPVYAYGLAGDLEVQPDGKIVGLIGYADYDENCQYDGLVLRYLSNGSPDVSFNENGVYLSVSELNSFSVQPADAKIVAGGTYSITRLTAGGTLDSSFGSNGVVSMPPFHFISSVAVQPNGKIVAGGGTPLNSPFDFAVFRFNSDGSPDLSFDQDGIISTPISKDYDAVRSIVIQADGKIVAGGWSNNGSNNDFAFARYNSDGSLDVSFGGGGGKTTVDFDGHWDAALDMTLDGRGRLMVVGSSNGTIAAARLHLWQIPTAFDFDGDGMADQAVFRPGEGNWYLHGSFSQPWGLRWGLPTDRPVPADYDGDGITDAAVYREGVFWILKSMGGYNVIGWGLGTDRPVPADYDGDSKADPAVYRGGAWWVLRSRGGHTVDFWGLPTDIPVPGDYDGDGSADPAVYRSGVWWVLKSTGGYEAVQWGLATDIPVPADYDGDGTDDMAIYRPGDGTWWILRSLDTGYSVHQWGSSSDVPVPADYDGDGRADLAIYRAGGWWILKSSGGYQIVQWGLGSDMPLPGVYLP
jgi:uncharacterized delta-60 repeat protein